ncbi:ATP-binding protein [Halorhabdus salina]|uniref:ATP-binding protein n=1 Tax=Halorhabdus salina TaxID=2750670 RepID=UPI0015EE54C3|nr:PAS domain-containing sensor histidine kinase [Halorhabdus salina]
MDHDELVAEFAQAVGVEKASAVVESAADSIGLGDRDSYETGDVIDICEAIQQRESGYLSMIATEVSVDLQAERRFETLLANVPEPAVVVEFEADEPIVSMVNHAFEETFGYDATAITGSRLEDLIVPGDATLSAPALWARSAEQSGTAIERVTADGQRRTFLFRSAIVTRQSGETEGYGIYTDITDRKRREQTLQHQNEQLERFVDVISHDLRNPLEVSTGQIELALAATDDAEVRTRLESALDANERMSALLEDLLSLAKQGQAVGNAERISLQAVARDAWEHVETGNATLRIDSDRTFEADPSSLSGLFENLFRNAVEHGSEHPPSPAGDGTAGGKRGVTITVGSTDDGFYVADDGPGIDPAIRDRIFEEGVTTNDEGTGFGLSIVETTAEAHGWSITAGESENGGARFDISF